MAPDIQTLLSERQGCMGVWQNNCKSHVGFSFYFGNHTVLIFWQQRILSWKGCSALRRPGWHYYNKEVLTIIMLVSNWALNMNSHFSKTQYIQLPSSSSSKNGILFLLTKLQIQFYPSVNSVNISLCILNWFSWYTCLRITEVASTWR